MWNAIRSRQGFELVSPCPFPTITITPRAPPYTTSTSIYRSVLLAEHSSLLILWIKNRNTTQEERNFTASNITMYLVLFCGWYIFGKYFLIELNCLIRFKKKLKFLNWKSDLLIAEETWKPIHITLPTRNFNGSYRNLK